MPKKIYARDIFWQVQHDLQKMLENHVDTRIMETYLKRQLKKIDKEDGWEVIVHTP